MSLVNAIVANLMPSLAGALVMMCLLGRPFSVNRWGFALGSGFFLGVGLTALANWLSQWTAWPDSPLPAALLLLLVTWAAGFTLLRIAPDAAPDEQRPANAGVTAGILWWVLLVAMLLNGFLLAGEALTRPMYPWDAWSAWSVKAKVWIELGQNVDFVSFNQWLASSDPTQFTNEAWSYPEVIPRYQLWVIQWVGSWDDQLALTPWLFAAAAMMLAVYHLLRLLQVDPLGAMCVTFLIAAIPILNVQVALAGLVDLWIAALLLVFCACVLLWLQQSRQRWIVAALTFLAIAAATKLEGLVWAVICLPVILVASQQRTVLRVLLVATPVAVIAWWLAGGFSFQLAGMAFVVTPSEIAIPYLGRYVFTFSNQLGAFVRSFLSLPNWHLTWYLLIPAIAWAVYRSRFSAMGRGLAGFAVVSLAFLFFLFFMTQAGIWAESMTASNRLALQFVPACIMWAGLLILRDLDQSARPQP
ncbi:MAG: hypothetical protein QNJ40_01850 [Xanthomonadales bacterium]|nr:hypothetical protein [Xanthomonadales bacterium]